MNLTSQPRTLGVIGGGQLCRMICEAASPLGFEVVFLDPTPDAPARPVARSQVVSEFDSAEGVDELTEYADYITYDIELADPEAAEDADVPVHPKPETLRLIQDKYRQKEALSDRGIPVPKYTQVDTVEDLREAADSLDLPLMVKARKGGYDGRGNYLLESRDDFEEALEELRGGLMAEEFIEYDRELSVIGVKGDGETDVYPVTETVHREEILRKTVTPARTSPEVAEKAREVAYDVLEVMEGRGVYGIELFEHDGSILVNEIAPRPHNSGHWSIEGAETSQFEQHVRAVTGLPLGSTELRDTTVSVNILGESGDRDVDLRGIDEALSSGAGLHWYGKRLEYPLRKMGHFTLTGEDTEDLLREADEIRDKLSFEP